MNTTTETTMATKIEIGTRIYNRGDMCNPSHFGTVTRIFPNDRFGDQIEITPDEGTERGPYRITSAMVSTVDKGNGSTRIVTEAAYRAFHAAQTAHMRAEYEAMMRRRAMH
jgi:hypothetical protein